MKKKRRSLPFPRNKAHPDQAGVSRRFLAFALDSLFITVLSLMIFALHSEATAPFTQEKGVVTQFLEAIKKGKSFVLSFRSEKEAEKASKEEYLKMLGSRISAGDYRRAENMTREQIEDEFAEELQKSVTGGNLVTMDSKKLHILREFVVGYIYFALFFHSEAAPLARGSFISRSSISKAVRSWAGTSPSNGHTAMRPQPYLPASVSGRCCGTGKA